MTRSGEAADEPGVGVGRQVRRIVANTTSLSLDPRLPRGVTWNSRAVIDACRPFEMLNDFPPVARASPELRRKVEAKFREVLSKL